MAVNPGTQATRSKMGRIRTAMLIGGTGIALLIGLRHVLPGEVASGGSFDAFCPFGAIETLWLYATTGRTLSTTNLLNFTVLGGVLAVSLVAGRAFCGWMCPVGAVQEFLARLARRWSGEKRHVRGKASRARLPLALRGRADRILRRGKILSLAVILVASVVTVYPPLYDLCPARALFSLKLTTGLLWSVLIFFIGTSLLVERAWCKYLCPLGPILAFFNKIAPLRIVVDHECCNHCGRCDVECSMGIQDVPERLRDMECIQCLECLDTCARDGSLTLKLGKK
jgi:polyferredoxin